MAGIAGAQPALRCFLHVAMVESRMKLLKGLTREERTHRWRIVLHHFESKHSEGLPWGATTTPCNPDEIIEMSEPVGELISVHSYFSPGNWFCVSGNQVSQSVGGRFEFLEFGKGQIRDLSRKPGHLSISGIDFAVPDELVDAYADMIEAVEADIAARREDA